MSNKEIKMDVQTRKDENNSELRKEGIIPAVLYGNKVKNQKLKINRNEFEKIYTQIGEAGLIELNIDSKTKIGAVVKEVQKNHVKDIFVHVDFYQVDMKKKIEVEIALNFIGEPEAVKKLGGVLTRNLNAIKVQCLPGDLIESIDVDISKLKTFSDKIKVSDLVVPAAVEIITDKLSLIANVLEPRIITEEEEKVDSPEGGAEVAEGEEKPAEGEEKKEEEKTEEKK